MEHKIYTKDKEVLFQLSTPSEPRKDRVDLLVSAG